ncbi:hypothetical protein EYF80_021897 [Liparis tanakae]|uniref:Uncharacterized protein n=1 Tax=Liparis tanakae TaxID=230148 RepID=A0A4Z2HQ42_9TELE|nr:hypothetical protein EYF80_021897 [Liparis tanakae]
MKRFIDVGTRRRGVGVVYMSRCTVFLEGDRIIREQDGSVEQADHEGPSRLRSGRPGWMNALKDGCVV